jgi:hypothetical protein
MPKASVVLANGTKVTVEGTSEEVAQLVQQFSGHTPPAARPHGRSGRATSEKSPKANQRNRAKGPSDYVRDLVASNYFQTKRGLSDVQKKLEEGAHIYAVTHISPVLFRLVRSKELRRIKEGGTWKYVNP